eukprot:980722-Rhodomonas_salina.1
MSASRCANGLESEAKGEKARAGERCTGLSAHSRTRTDKEQTHWSGVPSTAQKPSPFSCRGRQMSERASERARMGECDEHAGEEKATGKMAGLAS